MDLEALAAPDTDSAILKQAIAASQPAAARAPLGVRDYARGPPPFAPLLSSHGLSPFASEPGVAAASATSPAFTPVEALEHGQASTTSTKKDAAAMLTMMMNMAAAAAPALEQENRVAL